MANAGLDNLFFALPPVAPASAVVSTTVGVDNGFSDLLKQAGQPSSDSQAASNAVGDFNPDAENYSNDNSALRSWTSPSYQQEVSDQTNNESNYLSDQNYRDSYIASAHSTVDRPAATPSSQSRRTDSDSRNSKPANDRPSKSGKSNSDSQASVSSSTTQSRSESNQPSSASDGKSSADQGAKSANDQSADPTSAAGSGSTATSSVTSQQPTTALNSAQAVEIQATAALPGSSPSDSASSAANQTSTADGQPAQTAANDPNAQQPAAVVAPPTNPLFTVSQTDVTATNASNAASNIEAVQQTQVVSSDASTAEQQATAGAIAQTAAASSAAASNSAGSVASEDSGELQEALIDETKKTLSAIEPAANQVQAIAASNSAAAVADSANLASAVLPVSTTEKHAAESARATIDAPAQASAAANKPGALPNSASQSTGSTAASNTAGQISTTTAESKVVAPVPSGTASQVDQVRFVQRVANAFRAADEQGGQIRLRLSPPELGSLKVEITVRNGTMTAHVETENSTARSVLLDNLPALREKLAGQNIKIDRFDVDLKQDGAGNGSANAQPDFSGARNSFARSANTIRTNVAGQAEGATTAITTGNAGASGNGGINIVV